MLLKLVDKERLKTQEQRELVMTCHEHILRMEEQVGVIADNPNYMNMKEMASTHGFSKANRETMKMDQSTLS